MANTTNLNLEKPTGTDNYSIDIQNANMDKVDAAVGDISEMKVAGGTGTVITLDIPSLAAYKANQKFSFVASFNNGGAATTINVSGKGAKNLYKPNTTVAPTLIAGKAYEVWYNGTHFFLKASAEGTAIAANVLAGTTFSNDEDAGIAGTMVDRGSVGTQNLTSEAQEYTIPVGYHNGLGKVKAVIAGLIAAVIKAGTTVGGIVGTFTADATASAGQMLNGMTAYVNGSKVTGAMANKSLAHSAAVSFDGTSTVGRIFVKPTAGYYDGVSATSQAYIDDPDFVAGNIKKDVNLFSLVGTFAGGGIKSIQRGTASISAGAQNKLVAITAVDMTKSIARQITIEATGSVGSVVAMLSLTSNTQLSVDRIYTGDACNINWEVIEFFGVKSVQTGTTTVNAYTTEQSVTISSVNPLKTLSFISVRTNDNTTGQTNGATWKSQQSYVTSATNLFIRCGSAGSYTGSIRWFVVEFE